MSCSLRQAAFAISNPPAHTSILDTCQRVCLKSHTLDNAMATQQTLRVSRVSEFPMSCKAGAQLTICQEIAEIQNGNDLCKTLTLPLCLAPLLTLDSSSHRGQLL